MPELRRVVIQRLDNGPGVRECFYVQPGRRRDPWIWFDPEDVPPFSGRQAVFEIERRGKRWAVVWPNT